MTARKNPEAQMQAAIVGAYAIARAPNTFLTSSLAGVNLGGRVGFRINKAGYRAGTPDLCFCIGGRSLWIELKTKRGSVSPAQRDCHRELREAGAEVVVCRSVSAALEQMCDWGLLRGTVREGAGTPLGLGAASISPTEKVVPRRASRRANKPYTQKGKKDASVTPAAPLSPGADTPPRS